MDKEKINNYYLERSQTAGMFGSQLAWAYIILLCAQLVGGSKYAEFYNLAGAGCIYLCLSMLQALWQAVTAWWFKQSSGCKEKDDYPNWIGFVAWMIYLTKMTVICNATVYAAIHFFG